MSEETHPDAWRALDDELDRWTAAGRRVGLWLRDDDAIAASPALDRLSELGERFGLPVLLAIIPMLAEPSLSAALRDRPILRPCQHGCRHRNHATKGQKKSEFGPLRAAAEVAADIDEARRRLADVLGSAPLPVFVPPWNRIDPGHAALLPGLGFAGLSCFRGYELGADGGPRLANTDLDVIDWSRRAGRSAEDLIAETCKLLASKRTTPMPDGDLFGVLTHHRDHDATVWRFLDAFLARMTGHPAVTSTDPRTVFGLTPAP